MSGLAPTSEYQTAYVNLIAALVASKLAFTAYGEPNLKALGVFYGAMALAFAIGGFNNFFLNRPFVSDAVFALVITTTLAFAIINGAIDTHFMFAGVYYSTQRLLKTRMASDLLSKINF